MDKHFLTAPVEANLPMLMGLASVFNSSVLGLNCVAVLPYCQVLLPAGAVAAAAAVAAGDIGGGVAAAVVLHAVLLLVCVCVWLCGAGVA